MTDDFETRVRWSAAEWTVAAAVETDPVHAENQRLIAATLRLRGAANLLELHDGTLPLGVNDVDAETRERVEFMLWDAERRIEEADNVAMRQAAYAARDLMGIPRIPRTSLDD